MAQVRVLPPNVPLPSLEGWLPRAHHPPRAGQNASRSSRRSRRDHIAVDPNYRATVGVGVATILVVVALSPGGAAVMEPILLALAGLVLLATLAARLPLLHRLRMVGSPRVTVRVTIGDEATRLTTFPGATTIIRVGITNGGGMELERARLNVLLPAPTSIESCTHDGAPVQRRDGQLMPETSEELIPGRASTFWFERVDLDPGPTILHFACRFPEPGDYPFRVKIASKSLYGRVVQADHTIHVVEKEQ